MIDLDGDGLEFTDLAPGTAYFDLDGDGFATKTAWVGPDDGLLVLDRNGDGTINGISELFGNEQAQGFQILGELDTNGDGTISAADQQFAELRIWQDLNGDGISQAEELITLEQAGIASVSLANSPVDPQPGSDVQVAYQGTFTRTDGTTGTIADVYFTTDPLYSRYVGQVTIDPEVMQAATIRGYGTVADLHIAMSLDGGLRQTVLDAVANPSLADLEGDFLNILYQWAGVEDITIDEIDPDHVLNVNPSTGEVVFSQAGVSLSLRQLGAIRKFCGMDVLVLDDGRWLVDGVVHTTGAHYEEAWETIYRNNLLKFAVANGMLIDYLPNAVYNPVTDQLGVIGFNVSEHAQELFGNIVGNIFSNPGNMTDAHGYMLSALVLLEIDPTVQGVFDQVLLDALPSYDLSQIQPILSDDLFKLFHTRYVFGTDNSDAISGSTVDDLVIGLNGNDTLHGEEGNDSIYGGVGSDTIYGGAGDNLLEGGTGNDYLEGASGADRYIFNLGSGQDTVLDNWSSNTAVLDTVQFGEGLNASDIKLYKQGWDLKIMFNGNATDSLIIKNYFYNSTSTSSYCRIERFEFSDGTVLTDTELETMTVMNVVGTSGNDNISGSYIGTTYDLIYGYAGNDTLSGNTGDDTIYGGDGDDNISAGDGDDLVYGDAGADTINGWKGNDVLCGGDGNDTISVFSGDNIFVGGTGNDNLQGAAGADRYIFNLGDGNDTIQESNSTTNLDTIGFGEGLNASDIRLYKQGDDLKIKFNGNATDSILIDNWFYPGSTCRIERFEFSDGTVLTGTELETMTVMNVVGTPGNDNISGSYISTTYDLIYGYAGNDTLSANAGDDTLDGGSGVDKMYGGAGNDLYYVDNTGDIVSENLNAGTDSVFSSLSYTLGSNVENLTLTGTSAVNGTGNTLNNYLSGNIASNSLSGSAGNDTLKGGAGNDTLIGGAGSDTYLFGPGDGCDAVSNNDTVTGSIDTATYTDAARQDLWFSQSGNDLVITVAGTADQVTVSNWYGGASYQLDMFTVSGYTLQNTMVDQLVSAMAAYAVPYGAGNDIPQAVQDALAPVIAATWQPGA